LENIRIYQSSGSLDFEVLIVGYEHVVMNCGSAGIRAVIYAVDSMDAIRINFIERQRVISSRNKATPLFAMKGEELNNVYDDIRAFCFGIATGGST
nr:hypothetical protein [Tanacetum cinerariifolium]